MQTNIAPRPTKSPIPLKRGAKRGTGRSAQASIPVKFKTFARTKDVREFIYDIANRDKKFEFTFGLYCALHVEKLTSNPSPSPLPSKVSTQRTVRAIQQNLLMTEISKWTNIASMVAPNLIPMGRAAWQKAPKSYVGLFLGTASNKDYITSKQATHAKTALEINKAIMGIEDPTTLLIQLLNVIDAPNKVEDLTLPHDMLSITK